GRWQLGIGGALFARSEVELRSSGTGATFDLLMADSSVGHAVTFGRLHLLPVVGVQIARLVGEARGAAVKRRLVDVLPIPFTGIEARWEILAPLAVFASADAGLPIGRSRFMLEGFGPLHEPSAVTGRASVGVRVALF